MAAFTDFLLSCFPSDESDALKPILTRFNLEFSAGAAPSVERPFKLSSLDIELLIDLARKYQSEKLLIALAGMCTIELNQDKSIKDPFHPLIGCKDPSIEAIIIAKAIEIHALKTIDIDTKSRIVYGLSGNPPTLNHLRFIRHLLGFGEVTVVLNAQSPLKSLDSYVEPSTRLEMLQSMIDTLEDSYRARCHLSRLEIDRPPPSRMAVTMSILTLLSQENEQFTLVLGLDALPSFTRWYQWEALGKLCNLKFYSRPGEIMSDADAESNLKLLDAGGVHNTHLVFNTEAECVAFLERYPSRQASFGVITDITEGSATQVRTYYKTHDLDTPPPPELNVHPSVHAIIRHYGLFRPEATESTDEVVTRESKEFKH